MEVEVPQMCSVAISHQQPATLKFTPSIPNVNGMTIT